MSRSKSGGISPASAATPGGRPGTRELGPSDLSDTGSDTIGTASSTDLDDDSDASGTGEGRDAGGRSVPEGEDLNPDRIIDQDSDESPGAP
jgi:hypothetical protein